MNSQMKTTKTIVTITLISMMLSIICSIMFTNLIGLSISDSIHILTNKEPFPIYLNTNAFRTPKGSPNSVWLVLDEHSLSPITKHSIKAYKSSTFKPKVPAGYYSHIRKENEQLLIGAGVFFFLAWVGWFVGLNRAFGNHYTESFFRAGRSSVGDQTQPFRDEITELKSELRNKTTTIKTMKDKLATYAQEKGPIKIKPVVITAKQLKACNDLGISPDEYMAKRKLQSEDSKDMTRERVRF